MKKAYERIKELYAVTALEPLPLAMLGNTEIYLLAKRRRAWQAGYYFPCQGTQQKSDVTRGKIIKLAGDLPRVELFAGQKASGWGVWGNKVIGYGIEFLLHPQNRMHLPPQTGEMINRYIRFYNREHIQLKAGETPLVRRLST